MIVTVVSISHLSSPPLIPNVKCIAWNFDGSNFVSEENEANDLKKLRFSNKYNICIGIISMINLFDL
jgi:hypothetical protein